MEILIQIINWALVAAAYLAFGAVLASSTRIRNRERDLVTESVAALLWPVYLNWLISACVYAMLSSRAETFKKRTIFYRTDAVDPDGQDGVPRFFLFVLWPAALVLVAPIYGWYCLYKFLAS